ncbi:Adaptive-response sensory-kinase SasA [Candidatus Entotheonellaceae bacterium PAL068K]
MTQERPEKQATMAQFYTQLYACVWQNLVPFLGSTTTLDLMTMGTSTLQDAYPFLGRLAWHTEGLEAASLVQAMTGEEPPHVQAGCERLLQDVQSLVREVGGSLLARRLQATTERLRFDFEPALSIPAPMEEVDHPVTPTNPQEAALPLMQEMGRQSLALYRRVQEQQTAVEQAQAELQALRQTSLPSPSAMQHASKGHAELVRSEAFYHSLFDLSPDGVVVTNMDGVFLQVNPRVAEILEFDTPDELIGRNAAEFYVHPEERAALLEQIVQRDYMMEGQSHEVRTRHGRTIILFSTSRLIDYNGQSYVLSVLRDVTERARLRQEMEDFAYSASHDIQAPLRIFEGYARWLLEDYGSVLDDLGRQLCEEIIDDALHMKKLLDGLLEYSRIGRLHTQAVAVDARQVMQRVLHDLQLEIIDTGAMIHVPESLPIVSYPEVRLTQIFSNLLSNALKFTAGKVPEVTIGCQDLGRYYRFTVRDNGIGIAPGHFDRIFEIFKRLHTREEYPGTGAGLTIVKKIVESHVGQIGVESVPSEGSTFWFTVPKTEDPHATTDRVAG